MEIRPTIQFPDQYDEIYYPGLRVMGLVVYPVGGVFAAMGAIGAYMAFTSPPSGTNPVQAALFCSLFVAAGIALIVAGAMVRGRTAIALTAEGMYYRDWLNRVWHLPWVSFEQVTIRESFRRSSRSMTGIQRQDAFFTGRFIPEGRAKVKVEISAQMQVAETPGVDVDPMMNSIIRRAGLVAGEEREREKVWVKSRESEVGSRQSGTAQTQ